VTKEVNTNTRVNNGSEKLY